VQPTREVAGALTITGAAFRECEQTSLCTTYLVICSNGFWPLAERYYPSFRGWFAPIGRKPATKMFEIFTLLPQADGYCLEIIAYVVLFKKQTYD
jgi:hypothetical protein